MSVVVTLAQVQQWLETTKLTLAQVDPELAETARSIVFSALASDYEPDTWITEAATPSLVKSVISMLVAAWQYNKAYSEDSGDADYGIRLEARAYQLLEGIAGGDIALEEYPGVGAESETLVFYPDDLTGSSEITDARGLVVGYEGSEDFKFRMAGKF